MKKLILTSLLVISLAAAGFAGKPHVVMFYNLENLFDTINDPDKNDVEFLPDGDRKWNTHKYYSKLSNIERVIWDIAGQHKQFPAIIGVSEIENRTVLEDLIAQPKMKHANYRIVHYDSPDKRGVDCAFFYDPKVFKLEGSYPEPYNHPTRDDFYTRDLVTMWGTIDNEPFFFLVAHWPSRLGGKEQSSYLREHAAFRCRQIADSVRKINPDTKIVIMGDLNDDATDKSIVEVLGAKAKIEDTPQNGFFNPYIEMLKAGYGTLAYGDNWNLFDNIIVSDNLAHPQDGKYAIRKGDGAKFYGNIFSRPYMFQKTGQFKGYPLRTFVGTNFQNGFSDHLPVFIYIAK